MITVRGCQLPICSLIVQIQQVSALRAQFSAGAVAAREVFAARIVQIQQVSALRAQFSAGAVTAREIFVAWIVLIQQVSALRAQFPAGAVTAREVYASFSSFSALTSLTHTVKRVAAILRSSSGGYVGAMRMFESFGSL